jgi:hypothetical protein
LCEHENVYPFQKFVSYCLSSFPNDEQYKYMHHKHPRHKKYFLKKGHLGWANSKDSTLKAKFIMKYYFLPRSSRCKLNLGGVHLSLVKVIA